MKLTALFESSLAGYGMAYQILGSKPKDLVPDLFRPKGVERWYHRNSAMTMHHHERAETEFPAMPTNPSTLAEDAIKWTDQDSTVFKYRCVRGLVSEHSVNKFEFCPSLKVLGEFVEYYSNGETCSSKMVEHEGGPQAAINEIQPQLKQGHFALLFDNDHIYVLFNDKLNVLNNTKPWIPGEFEHLCAEGESRGIDKIYFEGIRDAVDRWY